MAQFLISHAVLSVLCFSLVLVQALATETFTTEFGKRKIPVDLIRQTLQPHLNDIKNIELSRVVYEIVDGNELVGFDTKLNLKDDTKLRPSSPSSTLKYTLNGNERLLMPSATVRYGKGFTVMHRASDGRVVHVFGNGLNLKLLDPAYPDVFVNTLATDPTRETAMDRTEVAERITTDNDLISLAQNSTVRQLGSCASGITHYLELAVAFDNQFCEMFSNDEASAATAVQTLVSQADEVFQEFTCVSIALVHIEAHCNDPADPYAVLSDFTRAQPGEDPSLYIQRAFGDFWEQSRTDVQRDAAYFLSGFNDGTNTAGRAGLGAACGRNAYGWSERIILSVFIHELGHITGSDHTPDGVMIATGFIGDEIFFSQESINSITGYVDSLTEDCLSTSAPIGGAPITPVPNTTVTEIPVQTPLVDEPSTPMQTVSPRSPEESTSPRPGGGTCGAALADSETLVCGSSLPVPIVVISPEGQRVSVMVRLQQRGGMFKAILSVENGVEIRQVAARLTTDGSLGPNDVGPLTLNEEMPASVTIEEDAFEMALSPFASTCCGENLYLYVQLEVCLDGECIISGVFSRSMEILCSNPCASSPGGKVVPFSATETCPSCRE